MWKAWTQEPFHQSRISLNLRTGPTGHATLFNQWEGALVFINKQIKTSPQWSKISKQRTESDRINLIFQRKHFIWENKSIIHCKESLGCSNWFRTDHRGRGFTGMACKIFDRSKLLPCKNSLRESVKICWDHTKQGWYYLLTSTGQESKNQSSSQE